MKHDDRKQQAALALSIVFVLLGCGWMALLQIIKPAGLVGESAIVGNRDTGAIYARIDGRLYPALNLTSARLVTGSAENPAWVHGREIDKHPTGPLIGIAGAPDEIAAQPNPISAWTLCDTAPTRAGSPVVVTAIAGELPGGGRAEQMTNSAAVLATHANVTYLIWNGRRTPIDLADRSVIFTLGIDAARTRPVAISNALFDALPATEPLVVPPIPGAGSPSRWLRGIAVGRVLVTQDAGGAIDGFFVVLPTGIQKITAFVADLLRAADSRDPLGPQVVAPGSLVAIPQVRDLSVDFYPTAKPDLIDTVANPVTCLSWRKQSTDRQATITVLNGRGLPTPQALDTRIVGLVRDSRGMDSVEAQQVLVLSNAATFVASTSAALDAETRETLYWLSAQGVRFGVQPDQATLDALGLDPRRAVQAPWPLLRTFAAGPVLSRANALVARDTMDPAGAVAAVPSASDHSAGR